MPAQLVALTEGPNILLDKPILLFGRHPECDILIDSRKVSRRHCCIAQVNDYLVIRDLGSTNGIRINGVRVVEGQLRAGDEVTIGSHRYRVRWDLLGMLENVAPARPVQEPIPPLEDEMLEACDEPVPLAEQEGPPPLAASHELPSFALPDDLELAPSSDVQDPPPDRPAEP